MSERRRERREAPAAAQVVEIFGNEVGVSGSDLGMQRLEDGPCVRPLFGQPHRRAGQHPMGHAQRARVHHMHAIGTARLLDEAARHLVGARQPVSHGEVDHLFVGVVSLQGERRRRRCALRQRARAHLRQELLGRHVLVFEPALAVDGHDERKHGHAAPRALLHREHNGRVGNDLHGEPLSLASRTKSAGLQIGGDRTSSTRLSCGIAHRVARAWAKEEAETPKNDEAAPFPMRASR